MILRKSGDTTVINQGSEGGGGGSQPSVALGPLLTSLNSEAMPSAEGYLHWTGSAWAFDTPTGGDPVDLTPYALKTWVQDNFAYKNDLVNFITKTEADGYYAALNHTHANYLPLSAGANKALTGSLYFSGNSGINWAGGVGMLACTPESGWTGISSSQWGVGALSAQGVIRSNANDILHYRNGTNYKVWDAYNFTPSDYLPLTGGTVESLTVTNGLDADSITVSSIVNSDTLAEYLDQDASDARYLQLTGGTVSGNVTMNGGGIYFKRTSGGNVDGAILASTVTPPGYQSAVGCITIGGAVNFDNDGAPPMVAGEWLATQEWVQSQYTSLFTQLANYDGAVQITIGGTQKSLTIDYASTAGSANTAVNADKLDNHHADDFALASALGNYLPLTGGTMAGPLNMGSYMLSFGTTAAIYYAGGLAGNILVLNADNVDIMTAGGNFRWNSQKVATQTWVTAQLGSYLPLTGGTVNGNLNVKGTIHAQDSNGNNKVIIYGTTGNIRAEKVYIGGSTSGYEAATHNWVTSQGYQANVIESVKVNGTTLNPTNKAVDIPAATSDGSTFGVVAIGTGFSFDEDRLCVDTSTFATRTWADGRYLPLTAGSSKPLTGELFINKSATASATSDVALAIANNWTRTDIKDKSIGITIGASSDYYFTKIATVFESQNPDYLRPALAFYTMDSTAAAGTEVERMRIAANGNVGIGTTSPAYKLDVSGVIKATDGVMVRDANGNRVGLGIDGLVMMYPSSGSSASAYVMSFEYDASGSWPMVKTKFSARPQVITGQSGSTYTYTNVALASDLTDYATQSWVNGRGFASAQDLYDLGTLVTTGYLPLTAGSSHPLTGNIVYKGTKATKEMIAFIDNTANTSGNGIAIGGGGMTVIGGGESAANMASAWLEADQAHYGGDEVMYVCNDADVSIFTNATSWANKKEFLFKANGDMKIAGALYGAGGYIDLQYSDEINRYGGNLFIQHRGGDGLTGSGTGSGNTGNLIICCNGGSVGIGTRIPVYKLDVNGNTGVTGSLDVSIELSVGDVTNGGVWLSDSAFGVWTMSGTNRQDTELMSLASGGVTFSGDTIMTGKLAVGTTTFDGSNAKLQVGGNMFATGSITSKSNAGNVSLGNGNISATNLYISTVVFGNSNNDAAFYVSNGHIWARNSSGTSTMIV